MFNFILFFGKDMKNMKKGVKKNFVRGGGQAHGEKTEIKKL